MNNKNINLKEKLKQALASTFKVISDNFEETNNKEEDKSPKKFDLFEIDNLNSKKDFIKARDL